ncbi:MAG: arginine--tRNA ligase [Ilumatobacteraceae bacterium]
MSDPVAVISRRVSDALRDRFGPDCADVDPAVRPSEHADAQINVAMALAKRVGRSPRDVATELVAALEVDDVCREVTIAGPGFINVTFAEKFLGDCVAALGSDDRLGVARVANPETVVVDYSAPNVAKEMHVGHLRSTVIGDALVRMLEFVGHAVLRENHIGDWGTQFGMLIEHLRDAGESGAVADLSVGDLDGFYKAARRKFDADEEFAGRARRRVVALQSGDADTLRLWRLLVAESERYFEQVYAALGVRLVSGDVRGESYYNESMPLVVERLAAGGLLQRDDDADVVFPDGFTNRDNEPLPLIIRKRDGGFNYATSDLACVIDRVENRRATLLLYVVGAPQAQHLDMVRVVAEKAGWLAPPARMVHVAFGSVLGSDRKMLKSRSGDTIKLHDLLDEAVERAERAIAERNPDLVGDERSSVARMIGIGAVKYADLSTDRIKDYVFDWDRMLAFDGNTAPYLQYAHARICSVFRRADVDRAEVRTFVPTITDPAERRLALHLLQFDAAFTDALDKFSPHRLCNYLYDAAAAFSAFYEACPVLKADSPDVVRSRLALCDLTARVLAVGCAVLGIDVPERM